MKIRIEALVCSCLVFASAPAHAETNSTAKTTDPLPSKIVTVDGRTYTAVKLVRAEPDGLAVEYTPKEGGTGMCKLKFTNLPESFRKQFGYDPLKAAAFEQARTNATAQLVAQLWADEERAKIRRTERERMEAAEEARKARAAYEMAKEQFEAEIKIQQLNAQQKAADAAMINALNPPVIQNINQTVITR